MRTTRESLEVNIRQRLIVLQMAKNDPSVSSGEIDRQKRLLAPHQDALDYHNFIDAIWKVERRSEIIVHKPASEHAVTMTTSNPRAEGFNECLDRILTIINGDKR